MDISIRWLWAAMLGGSIMLAVPGNTDFVRIAGDVVGHFFSALVLAIVPIVGYRVMYEQIGEKEITYIVGASWVYLVLSQFWSS
jgi:alkyl hydroperoxide reductase subunit AhpF